MRRRGQRVSDPDHAALTKRVGGCGVPGNCASWRGRRTDGAWAFPCVSLAKREISCISAPICRSRLGA